MIFGLADKTLRLRVRRRRLVAVIELACPKCHVVMQILELHWAAAR